ncbi:MAG TPA: ATP-grasp domain-containing protein [Chitinophagaceae bacterium]|nr:ATP-grasp domain-containing protein [Chitinophagaceae bacterium]
MNILITSAGQRVSLVRIFKKELMKMYPTGNVFTTDMCPHLSPACRVSDKSFQVKKVTDRGYIEELLNICLRYKIKMVIPTIDTELLELAYNKDKFACLGIHVVISSPGFVEKCRDKRKTNIFFQQHDIDIPRPIDKNNPSFPMFIKPYDGSLSADTFIIYKQEDIKKKYVEDERYLFMEYINKQEYDEYTVDMYYDRDSILKCLIPRKRLVIRAGEITKGITCKNSLVPFLKTHLEHIEGVTGCITAQFFLHKTEEHIMAIEINPRFGGGYPLSYHAGGNYPSWLFMEYFNNEHIQYYDKWQGNMLMLRYDDEVIVYEPNS